MKILMPKEGIALLDKYRSAIIALFFLIVTNVSFAQTPTYTYQKPTVEAKSEKRLSVENIILLPTGCGNPALLNPKDSSKLQAAFYFDSCNHRAWFYDPKLKSWDSLHIGIGGVGGAADTSGLSFRIDQKLNKSDTTGKWLNFRDSIIRYVTPTQLKDTGAVKWDKSGNAGTNVSSNYLGTSDAVDLSIRTKGIERLRLDTNGRIYVKSLLNLKKNTYVVNTLYSGGTSIANGEILGMSQAYPTVIANNYNLTLVNLAVSGSGWLSSLIQQATNVPLTHTGISMTDASINDVRRIGITQGGNNQSVVSKKVFTTNHWLGNMQAAGNGDSVTTTGGGIIKPYASQSGYYTRTNATALSTSIGDTVIYNFSDSNVIWGFTSASNTVANFTTDMEVILDGTIQYHYNSGNKYSGVTDGVYNNAWGPDVLYFTGLSYGHHTLKLVNKTSNFMMIDYFGHFRTDIRQKPVIFDIEQCTYAGFNGVPGYTNANTAIVNYYNNSIDSLVNAFPQPYRPIIVHQNVGYDTATMIYPDGVHPNLLGHTHMATSGIAAIGPVNSISLDSNDISNINGSLYFYSLSGLQKVALENSNAFIKNDPATQQIANLNISGNNKTSVIGNKLVVGNAAMINTKTSLEVITGTNMKFHVLGATGDMDRTYIQSASDDRLTLKPLWIQGSQVNINSNLFNATPTNIGIGTTNVYTDSKLEIGQDANTTLLPYQSQIRLSGFSNPSLIFNGGLDTLKRAGFWQAANNPSNQLPIALNPQGGNVGINTWSPAYPLDVNGSANIGDTMRIGKTRVSPNSDSAYVKDPVTGKVSYAKINGSGGGTGSGLLHVVAGFGLTNVNDSTLKVDSSLIQTKADARRLFDSSGISLENPNLGDTLLRVIAPGQIQAKSLIAGYGFINTPNDSTITQRFDSATVFPQLRATIPAGGTGGGNLYKDVITQVAHISNIDSNYTYTASSAGTLTLTNASKNTQHIGGTLTHTVVLPNATTLPVGISYYFTNTSTGAVTVNKNGGTLLSSISGGNTLSVTLVDNSTSAGGWIYEASSNISELANATDANFTATANSMIKIPNGTLTANRTITMPTGTSAQKITFWNRETAYTLSLSGASCVLWDETAITSLTPNTRITFVWQDSKWVVEN